MRLAAVFAAVLILSGCAVAGIDFEQAAPSTVTEVASQAVVITAEPTQVIVPTAADESTPTITAIPPTETPLPPTLTPSPNMPTLTPSVSPTRRPVQTPEAWDQPFPNFAGCERPYTDSSLWNTPIDWGAVQPHPNSPEMMAHFFQGTRDVDRFVGSNLDVYKTPIWQVTSDQPLVAVQLENSYRDSVQEGPDGELIESLEVRDRGQVQFLPIPPEASPAPGTDGTMVVVVTDTGYEYGLREARQLPNGTWVASTAYEYHISFDGIPEQNFQFRGPDATLLGGGVRRCEVETLGIIPHALYIAYDYPASCRSAEENGWPCWIPPFTDSDGDSPDPFAIPEGARLAIDPDLGEEAVASACSGHIGCILWVEAMQTYGGFIMDRGGRPSTYIEGPDSADWPPELFDSRVLRNIPQEWYFVIDWDTENRPPN